MPRDRQLPLVVLAGVDRGDLEVVEGSVMLSLPSPVLVRHEIDVQGGTLTRHVSEAAGPIERRVTGLDHACMSCALRYEIVPTLVRLAESNRWRSAVVSLPVAAEPAPVVRGLSHMVVDGRPAAERIRVDSTVGCVGGARFRADLFGDDLLRERDDTSHAGDARAVGEVLARQLEYADVQAVSDGALDAVGRAVLGELCRPGSRLVLDVAELSPDDLVGTGRGAEADAWVDPTRRVPATPPADLADGVDEASGGDAVPSGVWTVFADTWRPFHPHRLMDNLEAIGGHGYRGRGCFWLPSRPDVVAAWDGAGGQLSVGAIGTWSGTRPRTRIVVTGVGTGKHDVMRALDSSLMTDRELVGSLRWVGRDDGFDPWLGSYSDTA
jgi:G3E family GTPase